jgi:hypothetical protein
MRNEPVFVGLDVAKVSLDVVPGVGPIVSYTLLGELPEERGTEAPFCDAIITQLAA